jgi:S1-C subfamily serine protease
VPVDLIVIAWVAVSALLGARRGLVANVLGLAGFAIGALVGARIAPHLLSGGSSSTWLPFASMIGALVGGSIAQGLTGSAAELLRGKLVHGPLRVVDTAGGLFVGALLGLAVAWLAAVVALAQPGLGLRRDVQGSTVLPALMREVPADEVLNALARFDPLPVIPSIADRALPPPDPSVLRSPAARRDQRSVVRIEGVACGLNIQGSGWVVRPGIVATNAHVVAGEDGAEVEVPGGPTLPGTPIAVDPANDVALLRVPGLHTPPLPVATRSPSGDAVVLIGYPENGPLTATPGRIGRTSIVASEDAYGHGPVLRGITALSGAVRHGDSGAPAVDARGRVETTVFAAKRGARAGYGVPSSAVRRALDKAHGPVSTGGCAP